MLSPTKGVSWVNPRDRDDGKTAPTLNFFLPVFPLNLIPAPWSLCSWPGLIFTNYYKRATVQNPVLSAGKRKRRTLGSWFLGLLLQWPLSIPTSDICPHVCLHQHPTTTPPLRCLFPSATFSQPPPSHLEAINDLCSIPLRPPPLRSPLSSHFFAAIRFTWENSSPPKARVASQLLILQSLKQDENQMFLPLVILNSWHFLNQHCICPGNLILLSRVTVRLFPLLPQASDSFLSLFSRPHVINSRKKII